MPQSVRPILGGPRIVVRVRRSSHAESRYRGLAGSPFPSGPLRSVRFPSSSLRLPQIPQKPPEIRSYGVEPPDFRADSAPKPGITRKFACSRRKCAISCPFRRISPQNTTRRANLAWRRVGRRRTGQIGRPLPLKKSVRGTFRGETRGPGRSGSPVAAGVTCVGAQRSSTQRLMCSPTALPAIPPTWDRLASRRVQVWRARMGRPPLAGTPLPRHVR
jgi:hypothetical protein